MGELFDKIVGSIANGKSVDRLLENSNALNDVKQAFLGNGSANGTNGNSGTNGQASPNGIGSIAETLGLTGSGGLTDKLRDIAARLGIGAEDIKTMSVAALISQMMARSDDRGEQSELKKLLKAAKQIGVEKESAASVVEKLGESDSEPVATS